MKFNDLVSNNALFTTQEAVQFFSAENSMHAAIKKLVADGKIVRIKNGLYASVNSLTGGVFVNRFEIATALAENAYVGYHSALEYHGLSNQMFSTMYVVAKTAYRTVDFDGVEYKFVTSPITNGIIELEQNSTIRVTDLERTVLDCINRIDLAGGLEELITALNGIMYLDENKLLQYLKVYDKKSLYKKTGYLLQPLKNKSLSAAFFDACKQNMSSRVDTIVENKQVKSYLNNEWQLIVPQDLTNTEN